LGRVILRIPYAKYPRQDSNATQNPTGKTRKHKTGGAESGAPGDATATIHNPVPSDLRLVIDRWSTLPPAIRAAVLALVKAGA